MTGWRPSMRWLCRHSRSIPREERSLLCLLAVLLIYTYIGLDRRLPTEDGAVPEAGCDAAYRMSAALHGHEEPASADAVLACRTPQPPPQRLRRCLRYRRWRQRRPTSVLLVGDSRLRHLYSDLGERAAVFEHGPDYTNYSANKQARRQLTWLSPLSLWRKINPQWADFSAASSLLKLHFAWRPYLNEDAVRFLSAAADDCERSPSDCPHRLIINAGMWYSPVIADHLNVTNTQMSLLFRQHMTLVVAPLRRLAKLTRVVWRLDERVAFDSFYAHSEPAGLPHLPILHGLVYELRAEVPGLEVWSSLLPANTDFTRRTCFPLRDSMSSWSPEIADRHGRECGDAIHGSGRTRARFLDTLLADLCASEESEVSLEAPAPTLPSPSSHGNALASSGSVPGVSYYEGGRKEQEDASHCCGVFRDVN